MKAHPSLGGLKHADQKTVVSRYSRHNGDFRHLQRLDHWSEGAHRARSQSSHRRAEQAGDGRRPGVRQDHCHEPSRQCRPVRRQGFAPADAEGR